MSTGPRNAAADAIEQTEDRLSGGWTPRRPTAAIIRGEGCWLTAADGRKYLDLTSGYGVTPLGHCHPAVTRAIQEQAERLIACPTFLYNEQRALFLEVLAGVLPSGLDSVFLCNSGAEATEAAIKFAALTTGRSGFVALRNGFHGRTLGALSVTANPRARKSFEPLLKPGTLVDPRKPEALKEAIDESTAAVLIEVVQGEGGVNVCDPALLEQARSMTRERGALLIYDEVQTGFGRTGSWFAHDSAVSPDLMILAKGIANGFPLGAVAYSGQVADSLRPGCHGSTFGGNPLACAAGRATVETLRDEGIVVRAKELGALLRSLLETRLASHQVVREIRGRGLMIGIELRQKAGRYLRRLTEDHGVIALPAGSTVIRLLPPLIIEPEEITLAADAIASVLDS